MLCENSVRTKSLQVVQAQSLPPPPSLSLSLSISLSLSLCVHDEYGTQTIYITMQYVHRCFHSCTCTLYENSVKNKNSKSLEVVQAQSVCVCVCVCVGGGHAVAWMCWCVQRYSR